MKRILKFPVGPGVTAITTYRGAVPLHVDFQYPFPGANYPQLCLWMLVDDVQSQDSVRGVAAVMTGEGPPDEAIYVGTAQTTVGGSPYVAHVFMEPEQ